MYHWRFWRFEGTKGGVGGTPWLNTRYAHKSAALLTGSVSLSFCGFISITARNFWTTPILWKLLPQFRMVVHVTSGEQPATM